jgi:hypothetical protein
MAVSSLACQPVVRFDESERFALPKPEHED